MVDRLNLNEDLANIGQIESHDGASKLVLQGDGNVVLYRSSGSARWATSTNNAVSAIMQADGNFVLYSASHTAVWSSHTFGHPGAFLVLQDDGNLVIYDSNGAALWASNTMIVRQDVPGFLPSTAGFHFPNHFDQVPDVTIDILGKKIGIGDASKGLCGGMVFAARDYFEAGIPIPQQNVSPLSGPLFDYIVKRLLDSFDLLLPPPPLPPAPGLFITPIPPFGPGPLTYMHLMDPALPDHETVASQIGAAYRGRAWVMIVDSWPRIRTDIDTHHLSPIALIEIKNTDPTLMGMNHQVLAYGYSLDGTDLTLRLYDPNAPNDDTVTMSLNVAHPDHTTAVTNTVVQTVWCFFRPAYTFSSPPVPETMGQMWHTIRNPDGSWQPSYGLVEGQESNDPGPFGQVGCAGVGGSLHVVGLSSGGQMWHTIRNPDGSWQPSYGLVEGQESNDPGPFGQVGCAGVGGSLHVVGLSSGGQMWHTIRNPDGSWQPSYGLVEGQESNDPGPFGQVGCAGVGGSLHVVGLSSGGQMWHTIRNPDGSWQPSYGLVEGQESNDPGPFGQVGCAGVGGSLHVVGLSSGGQMWHTIRNPDGSWQPSYGLVEGQESNDPGPFGQVGCAGVGGSLHVVGLSSGGQMWHTIRNPDGSWQPSYGLVEGQESNDPGPFGQVGCAGVGGSLHMVGLTIR